MVKGGALDFEKCLPNISFRLENTFERNVAVYGPDYSSYPIRIQGENILNKYKIIPGIVFPSSFEFDLIDHYDQIVNMTYNTYFYIDKTQ